MSQTPYAAGRKAADRAQPYDSNPYPKGSTAHLLWSKGHNNQRVLHAAQASGRLIFVKG